MSFLQPWLLAALPLAALPIAIHMLNRRRHQTVEWGAMRFLLQADKMARGYARFRKWFIMAMRVLAIAVLVLAVSRPLSSGWVSLVAGGEPDVTMVLLDRSPSMQREANGVSKLETARRQLLRTFGALGSKRWVLIDSASNEAHEFDTPGQMLDATRTQGLSAAADLPAMMRAARGYLDTSSPGRAEVWIVSDLQSNDWQAEDARWAPVVKSLREFPGRVRFHLLAYPLSGGPSGTGENLAVRIKEARRESMGDRAEVVLSLQIDRQASDGRPPRRKTVPLGVEIGGSRTEISVELAGPRFELREHRVPLAREAVKGWGRVSLPADANPADNVAYFVFDEPRARTTAVVSAEPDRVKPFQLAASISLNGGVESKASLAGPDAVATLAWEQLALLIWQAPLPTGDVADRVKGLVNRGGRVLFLPPAGVSTGAFLGVGWGAWRDAEAELRPGNWRRDQDLLADSGSGEPLPVPGCRVRRHRVLTADDDRLSTLASLPNLQRGGPPEPLLARRMTDRGGVYFLTTTADPDDSSLAADGLMLYALVQRAIGEGAKSLSLSGTQQAGAPLPASREPWRRLGGDSVAGDETIRTVDYPFQQGVYASGERLVGVNRSVGEDQPGEVPPERLEPLFEGLELSRVDGAAADDSSLVREVWRLFLGLMMLAIAGEAFLSLPRAAARSGFDSPLAAAGWSTPAGRNADGEGALP